MFAKVQKREVHMIIAQMSINCVTLQACIHKFTRSEISKVFIEEKFYFYFRLVIKEKKKTMVNIFQFLSFYVYKQFICLKQRA